MFVTLLISIGSKFKCNYIASDEEHSGMYHTNFPYNC